MYVVDSCIRLDVKPDNILVSRNGQDSAIHPYLVENPSTTYDVRMEPDLSADPIITVKSQPLPNFSLDPNLSNLEVRLIDYGSGEMLIFH
jgi:serine/threonine-protein kinase SRPK3